MAASDNEKIRLDDDVAERLWDWCVDHGTPGKAFSKTRVVNIAVVEFLDRDAAGLREIHPDLAAILPTLNNIFLLGHESSKTIKGRAAEFALKETAKPKEKEPQNKWPQKGSRKAV